MSIKIVDEKPICRLSSHPISSRFLEVFLGSQGSSDLILQLFELFYRSQSSKKTFMSHLPM